jgi:sulfane dehydrogenase subunit SoxC
MDALADRPVMRQAGLVIKVPRRPQELLESITPVDGTFTLAHFGIPDIDTNASIDGWAIEIDGMVRYPVRFTLDELLRRPKRTVISVHECAGNPFKPKQAVRGVANISWSGVDLREILDEAGVEPSARFIWSYGVDHGRFGKIQSDFYLKDLPIERVATGGVMLAYEMNGEPLTLEHGAPVRLFIPGYYGTNCVKWLRRMTIADRRADGPMTTVLYNDAPLRSRTLNHPALRRPVWEIAPESVIVSPVPEAELPFGQPIEIWGWAWASRGVANVEVSFDGGATCASANLAPRQDWSWQRFSCKWSPDIEGPVTLASRAMDSEGATQPRTGARNSIYKVKIRVIRKN